MIMDHAYIDAHNLAARYLDDALEPELRADFESHLASCEECQDRVELARLMKQDALAAQQQEKRAVLNHTALHEVIETESVEEPESHNGPPPYTGKPSTEEKLTEKKKAVSEAAHNLARTLDWESEPETEPEQVSPLEPEWDASPEPLSEVEPGAEPEAATTPESTDVVESQPEAAEAQSTDAAPAEDAAPAREEAPFPSVDEHQPESAGPEPINPEQPVSEEPLKIQLVTQFKPWQIAFLLIAAGGILIALLAVILVLETSR